MIDLETIKARLAAPHAAGAYDITVRLADGRLCLSVRMRDWGGNTAQAAYAAVAHLLGHAPADLTALVAEVERLRGEAERERAAVVAWLRQASERMNDATLLAHAADCVEDGEHRREGDE